jgi:tetraacyldisaccharide 4'-kinase
MNSEDLRKIQKKARAFLFAPSLLYAASIKFRNLLYDRNILKSQSYKDVKIISVGNIAAGGVGKTPVVIALSRKLSQYGKTCVITGNYPFKDKMVHIVSIEGSIFKKPDVVSDEAYMIAKKVDVSVIASKSRRAAIELASGLNMKYIILDDALHKRDIVKDLEVCVVDKEMPFEEGYYLPAGSLRDSKSSIKRCDEIVCVNKTNYSKKKLACHEAKFTAKGIFNNKGIMLKSKNPKAFVFCGIGKPLAFIEDLKTYGVEVVGYKFFKDHYRYTKNDILMLNRLKEASKADILLTTFKDFVKVEGENIYYFDVELEIENLDSIIERIA